MFIKVTILVAVAFLAGCIAQHHGHSGHATGHSYISYSQEAHHPKEVVYHTHPKYEYKYGISDSHTKDNHNQHEHRDGDVVHGEYSLHEPDGTIRIVKYTADHKNGFNAQVIRKGHAVHPETAHKSDFVHFHSGHGGSGGQGSGLGGHHGN